MPIFFVAFALTVAVSCKPALAEDAKYASDEALPKRAEITRMVVDKAAHTLAAYDGETLLKVYTVALGAGGDGHKVQEGDGKTPEGTYTIDSRHRSKRFHRFLHVSYPNKDDEKVFKERVESGILVDASIGGDIGIHGESRTWTGWPHKTVDWTAGCIAVDDDEIEELYRAVVDGAEITIVASSAE